MANIGIDILGLPTTVGGLTGLEWVAVVQGGTTKRTQSVKMGLSTITQVFPAGIDYVITATGAIPVGASGTGLVVPFNCTINQVVLNGNAAAGSAVVDIWKCTENQYDGGILHPISADSITASARPTIVAGSKYSDSTLTGWTTTLTQGDVLWYNVVSNSAFTSLTIALKVSRAIP